MSVLEAILSNCLSKQLIFNNVNISVLVKLCRGLLFVDIYFTFWIWHCNMMIWQQSRYIMLLWGFFAAPAYYFCWLCFLLWHWSGGLAGSRESHYSEEHGMILCIGTFYFPGIFLHSFILTQSSIYQMVSYYFISLFCLITVVVCASIALTEFPFILKRDFKFAVFIIISRISTTIIFITHSAPSPEEHLTL